MKQKFEVGEIIFVKADLTVGNLYESEDRSGGTYWSRSHKPFGGKFGVVVEYNRRGYKVRFGADIDQTNIYYDEMLEAFVDTLKDGDSVTQDVEKLVRHLEIHNIQRIIDNGLEKGMYKRNPEGFQKLVDTYKELSEK
ncbi:hypothetical protein PQE72_gp078 [Bacillus phage vB_BanS_Skywalker]|uniref:Uncharacterized protein n=3 Tax=Caudoviricetes TaxID=2731619 RepID=A0AAE8YV59_9CAUD|nr:hypothetical protein PQE72_gp078 [Bacillus phage vB_BanS_Skywalker]YP_010680956.1 hypothetical protein PQE73_gp060 [Bacillus phage vB_BanS_MrDarsey]UGO47892.1 hypothetical protein MRDARSEY_60 [Bacillus phage vB_BanS_MrDarsey]UGO51365.1 hypothetical protein SKYWALKER_208 [Bacillus phage vB_BanS_Skywalker]